MTESQMIPTPDTIRNDRLYIALELSNTTWNKALFSNCCSSAESLSMVGLALITGSSDSHLQLLFLFICTSFEKFLSKKIQTSHS
jgi:hypothetical protein